MVNKAAAARGRLRALPEHIRGGRVKSPRIVPCYSPSEGRGRGLQGQTLRGGPCRNRVNNPSRSDIL